MAQLLERDRQRYLQIIKGKLKKNLKFLISRSEMWSKRGGEVLSIPLSRIEIPRLRFDQNSLRGIGQGKGEIGEAIAKGGEQSQKPGEEGKAGNLPGTHGIDVDVTLEEMIRMLGEELELPNIEPKGQRNVMARSHKFSSINRVGPRCLVDIKRTFKRALKRHLVTGHYQTDKPEVVPISDDFAYRTWKIVQKAISKAVIIYMMDVSGSMGAEQKEIVRITSFWIDSWLRYQYGDLDCRYIIHDASAKEVDHDTFYHTKESGGTLISSAYRLATEMVEKTYMGDDWNVYFFHFSDGDNWSGEDTKQCVEILRNALLTRANLFCYGQVESRYGSGQFLKDLYEYLPQCPNLITAQIENKDAIYGAIKRFLGKGK